LSSSVATAAEPSRSAAAPSGVRSGALLAAATLTATALNYVFLLATGRLLGSDDYGALAALLGLLTLVVLPTGAVQLAVSREVSRRVALGDEHGAAAFGRALLRLGLVAGVPLAILGLVLVLPVRELLNIESTSVVALAMAGLGAALVLPIAMGLLQGYQRFSAIAALYVLPFVIRLALLAVLAAAGYRLGGAVVAALVAGVVTAMVTLWLLRDPLLHVSHRADRAQLVAFLHYLWPVLVGLIGIAVLTNVDVVLVRARFPGDEAGEYAAASAFARIAFFLPATILTVLFPRTAARQARGEDTADILGRSLLVAAGFCSLLTIFYALTGRGLVHTSFGEDFADGGAFVVPLTISMTLFALANVLVGFHLSRGESRFAWIVAGTIPVQIAALALIPSSVRGVIWIDIVIGVGLLAAHEIFVGSSVPALRAGLGRVGAERWTRIRRVTIEALAVAGGLAVLVCVLFWPVVSSFGSTFVGTEGSDSAGTVGWLWRLQQEGYHLFGTTTHALTGAPLGWDEPNGLNLQWLLYYYPAYLAAGVIGEVAAFNLVVFSGYVLSGLAMYFLARYLECNRLVSAWAALVFVIFPWHLERAEHPGFLHLEVLVLLVVALVAAAERTSSRRLLFVGAATLACWLAVGYFGVVAAIGACAFAVAAAFVLPRGRRVRLVLGVIVAAFAATMLMAVAGVSGGVGSGGGLERQVGDLQVFGLRANELVVPSGQNLFFGDRLKAYHEARQHGSNGTETENYLGLLTIALALGWLVAAWRRRRQLSARVAAATAGLVGIVVTALLFALPTPLNVFGVEFTWPPTRVLWELIPAFRVPSRWITLLVTALVPLAALGLQAAWNALGRSKSVSRAAWPQIALVVGAMAFSFFELAINPAEPLAHTQPVPPAYAVVSRLPEGVLAEYPLRASDIYNLWQHVHGRPLLTGAPEETPADDLRRVVMDPAAPGTAEALAALGVTAMIIHPGSADVEVAPNLPTEGEGYEKVASFDDGTSVWHVTARPAPAVAFYRGPDFGPPHVEDGTILHPLFGSNGRMDVFARNAGTVEVAFEALPAEGTMAIRVVGKDGEITRELSGRTPVSIRVEVPAGRSELTVWTEPPPEGGGIGVELSSPRATDTSEPAELRAGPASP